MDEASQVAIELNGEIRTFPLGTTLATVVAERGYDPISVATAINGSFVARHMRQACMLGQGDVVVFFAPMVGG
jgi:sulfur carrier protein